MNAAPARIARLEAELHALKQQQRDDADRSLITAIARSIGGLGVVFSVGDVLDRRAIDPDLSAVLGTLRSKQIGKRLARCAGRELVEGVRLVRVREDRAGWMWVLDFHGDAGAGG